MSAHTALVVIDVQMQMFDESDPVYDGDGLLQRISRLITRARDSGVPVVYVQHHSERAGHPMAYGSSGWRIHPEIAPMPGELVVAKRTPDSFHETRLGNELARHGISKLVLTGIQTENCVDTTCRRAFSLGYDVTLVSDGHSTWNTDVLTAPQVIAHHNAVLGDWFATVTPHDAISFA